MFRTHVDDNSYVGIDGLLIPKTWISGNAADALAAADGNYWTAVRAKAANGRPVWECYVADLDPEDPDDDLVAGIEMSDGAPRVWILKGESGKRNYEIQGAPAPNGPWGERDENSRFFRIRVAAGFEPYTITFDTNGGSAVAPITAPYGATLTAPATPTKAGYDFAGWNPAFPATMPLGGAALVAQWRPKNYTITFDTDDGSAVDPITAAYGAALVEPTAPTKEGFVFAGWSPAFPATMPLGGATLVAQWTNANKFTWTVSGNAVTITGVDGTPTGSLVIPATINGYPVTNIGDQSFEGCSGLTSVAIPDSVTNIGSRAFYGCSKLTSITIPDSVTNIGIRAFNGCSRLTSITIPDSVTSIGVFAFSGCSGLKDVVVSGRFQLSSIFPSAYQSITNAVVANGVTNIMTRAFYGCSGLASITIPDSVTSIGNYAFSDCSELRNVLVPGRFKLSSIFPSAYQSITNAVVADGVTSIRDYAFSGCSGLTSVTIPNGVTSIGGSTFYNCSGLASITIPNSVTNIGDSAFSGCSGLTSITIPDGVPSIGNRAFYNCSRLTSITIPDSVTSIGEYAFYGCSGLTLITIPDSVTSIGNYAFSGCSGLTSITIPDSVTNIGNSAFRSCSGLTSLSLPGRFEGNTSSMGIPDGCTVTFRD